MLGSNDMAWRFSAATRNLSGIHWVEDMLKALMDNNVALAKLAIDGYEEWMKERRNIDQISIDAKFLMLKIKREVKEA